MHTQASKQQAHLRTKIMREEATETNTNMQRTQMWVLPSERGLRPNYGSMTGDKVKDARTNAWAHLVSNVKGTIKTPVQINQDVNMYVTEMSHGKALDMQIDQVHA